MKYRIVILGGGESGVGAAMLAQAKGYEVFLSDQSVIAPKYKEVLEQNAIAYEEGKHTESLIVNADEVVKSPGIPHEVAIVGKLKQKGIPVIGELEFASRFTNAKFIGITGTNGKTTTTLLTYHLLKESGLNVGLAGNVGTSLAKQVIKDDFDYYVVEISSFQLDDIYSFKPLVAVILNITPDHLDRYENSIARYAKSKFRITRNLDEKSYFIYFEDDAIVAEYSKTVSKNTKKIPVSVQRKPLGGAWKEEDNLVFNVEAESHFSIPLSASSLKGTHNAINTLVAISAVLALGVEKDKVKKALKTFRNAPHRLETVGNINGVTFINDSKATNVDAVYYALEGFKEPLVWIAGGVDKGNNYEQIVALVKKHVKALVCLGKDNRKLIGFFKDIIPTKEENESIQGAVNKAFALADRGDVVLLSPACASFDLFKNYEDRGDKFREAVKTLEERVAHEAPIVKK